MNKMAFLAITALCALGLSACHTTPVQEGAIAGGAVGAGLGAIAGHQVGRTGEGALIGAGAGALTGALIGDHIEKSTAPPPPPPRRRVGPAPPPPPPVLRSHAGRYEVRTVVSPTGERYEERVWVPDY